MTLLKRPGTAVALTFWLLAALVWVYACPHASRAFAQPVPVPAASTNPYWAGYIASDAGPYTAIQASWTIPAAPCANGAPNATTYIWIGEGGYLRGFASPLIQAGTASDCLAGIARYHAFFEWYPGIDATDFPILVQPGDSVTVRLQETASGFWRLSVRDDTTQSRSATSALFQADKGSAELIVERPTLCAMGEGCGQVALSRFGSVTFHDIHLRTGGGADLTSVPHAAPVALVSGDSDHALAIPARVDQGAAAVSVLWRDSS